MFDLEEEVHGMNVQVLKLFENYDKEWTKASSRFENFKEKLFKQIDKEYGFTLTVIQEKDLEKSTVQSSNEKENHQVDNENDATESATETFTDSKPRRNAAKNASSQITKQSQMKLNSKIRRPNNNDKISEMDSFLTDIKIEKSPVHSISSSVLADTTNIIHKTNSTNEMPPPADKPKRRQYKKVKKEVDSSDTENESDNIRQTRSKRRNIKNEPIDTENEISSVRQTRSKRRNIKKEPIEIQLEQNKTKTSVDPDSDVVITEVSMPIIVISDCEENVAKKQDEKRGSTQSSQVSVSDVENDNNKKGAVKKQTTKKTKKATKTTTIKIKKEPIAVNSVPDKVQEISLYEDVESDKNSKPADTATQQITLNTTHVIQKDSLTAPLNSTQILHKESSASNLNNEIPNLNCTVELPKLNETVTLTSKNDEEIWQKSDKIPIPSSADSLLTDDDTPKPLEKNKTNTNGKTQKKDSLFTDDDDYTPELPKKNKKNTKQETKKTIAKKNTKTIPVFSPYANSPVKNRVAAFEKLGATEATRSTRTKTRKLLQAETKKTEPVRNEPAKPKYATPITNHKIPAMIPKTTDGRLYRTPGTLSKNTSAFDISKFATTAKPSRAEIQEKLDEQKRRLEKEEEAQLKKNAMLQAKVEEQRKKREEKQIKAKTAREEKEREKEEKLRQLLREKDEKQQEELRKKQEWALRMATEAEEKRKYEAIMKQKYEEKKKMHEEKKKLYELKMKKLAVKPPPLPTDDMEDSDDNSSGNTKKYVPPPWARREALHSTLLVQRFLPQKCYQKHFQMQATTPDLREIFETIDERALRRNSSAIWNTPPRYSTLPKF